MNMDKAMETVRLWLQFRPSDRQFKENIAIVLFEEVERLRADRDSWRRVCEKETEAKHQAWAELAAAKAASVVPEESVIWLLAVAAKLEKDGESSRLDSMTKAANWLRDSMKERGER